MAAILQIVFIECPKSPSKSEAPRASAPVKEHFVYNYTIKGNGTHAMEITFLQDSHMWPYVAEWGLIKGIVVSQQVCLVTTHDAAPGLLIL
jgi:hypothetical protein